MIGSLKGIVDVIDNNYLIVDVNGAGYKVLVSNEILSKTKIGDKIKLFIYTHVREDLLELFGFLEHSNLKLFELLISVSGVGPKTALAIFSAGSYENIKNAITRGDTAFFSMVPRLGTKNAQKIIIELKNKLGPSTDLDINVLQTGETKEVLDALKQFGFTTLEIREAIKNIKTDGLRTEEKIKLALKYLGK